MHDIVRDYVISQHSEDELCALQRSVVDAALAARPEPDGFPLSSEHAAPNSFEGYVVRQLYWHMRGALAEGEELPNAWIAHPDAIVMANLAVAVGVDALLSLSSFSPKVILFSLSINCINLMVSDDFPALRIPCARCKKKESFVTRCVLDDSLSFPH